MHLETASGFKVIIIWTFDVEAHLFQLNTRCIHCILGTIRIFFYFVSTGGKYLQYYKMQLLPKINCFRVVQQSSNHSSFTMPLKTLVPTCQ